MSSDTITSASPTARDGSIDRIGRAVFLVSLALCNTALAAQVLSDVLEIVNSPAIAAPEPFNAPRPPFIDEHAPIGDDT